MFQACLKLVCVSTVFCCMYSDLACNQSVQSPRMPRATKNSAHVMDTSVYPENISVPQESSSPDQEMEVQSPSFQPSTSQAQFVTPVFMPYTEGPKMDLTVSDGL